jgi:hypothetical protein
MSYCRFSEGDVYLFPTDEGIVCCACLLAPKGLSLFTTGTDPDHLFANLPPCDQCTGYGCEACSLHRSLRFATAQETYAHLVAHRTAGHVVPEWAFVRLRHEGDVGHHSSR